MSPKHAKTEQAIAQMEQDQDNATEAKTKQEMTPEERQAGIDETLAKLRAIQKAEKKDPQEEKKLRRILRNRYKHYISKVKRTEKAEAELEEETEE